MKYERGQWFPDHDFAMLSMMGHFTDEELKKMGLTPENITAFRKYESEHVKEQTDE